MIKITTEVDIKDAVEAIRRMPIEDKIKLIRTLERETWYKRIDQILKNIDKRRRTLKISSKEISREIQKARRKFYEGRR